MLMSFSNMILNQVRNELEPFLERLFEGGAFGHLAHPFEDIDMTFGQMKKMVNDILSGRAVAYEKIDGQQISFSWKNGRLVAARNKSQLKNRGEAALTTDTIRGFIGKSGNVPVPVINAFFQAMIDLERALFKVPQAILQKMFQEGRFFMNSEVVAQETANIVPYYKDYIVFHGLIEYDQNGNQVGEQLRAPGKQLEDALRAADSTNQSKFILKAANQVSLKNFRELPEKRNELLTDLKQLQGKMRDENTISQQQELWWKNFILGKAREMGYKISPEVLNMLVGRWGRLERGVNTIPKITSKIDNDEFKKWMVEYDNTEQQIQYDKNLFPYEMFFLRLGAEVLASASGFLTATPDKSVSDLAVGIQRDAEKIKSSRDVDDLRKLKHELEVLEKIGKDRIAGTEGIVFSMDGKLYKLTGLFTPIHHILSILKYKKLPKQPVVEEKQVESYQISTYEDLLREGGNVVFTNSTLDRQYLEPTVKNALNIWGLAGIPHEIVGSKNKPVMGDIDVAIDSSDLGKRIGAKPVDRDVYWAKTDAFFKSHTPKEITGTPTYKVNKGLDQIHISAPIVGKEGDFVQIDLMLGDVGWMRDALSGTTDSKYKAVYRNQLLASILAHSHEPTKDQNVMKKYQINWKKGLQSVDIITKGGKIEKTNLQPVAANMNEVASFLFGPGKTFQDINTFEKLFKHLNSSSFRYKDKKDEIIKSFNEDLVRMKLPPVKE